MRVIYNLLLKRKKKEGLEISYTMLVLSLSLRVFGGGKELVGNFQNYSILLKSCASLLSLSLFEINTTQCLVG